MGERFRLDDLARKAEVATTTVRLYRSRGLLGPPRLEGRTGWYDESHLSRLRLVARLQSQGYSLAGIADLLGQWEQGRDLDAVLGVEAGLDALLSGGHALVLDAQELLGRFPAGAMTVPLMERAAALGLVEPLEDGRFRVADRRFLDAGATLARLGVPLGVVLDEWEALVAHTDAIAGRFIALFERYVAPDLAADRPADGAAGPRPDAGGDRGPGPAAGELLAGLDSERARALAATLLSLRATARQVLASAFDAGLGRLGRERLGRLLDERRTGRPPGRPPGR